MSDTPEQLKPKKTSKELQADFAQAAYKSGLLQYEIAQKTKDLSMLNEQMRDLSFEFVAVSAKERAEAAAQEADNAAKAAEAEKGAAS